MVTVRRISQTRKDGGLRPSASALQVIDAVAKVLVLIAVDIDKKDAGTPRKE